jgi:Na+/melibiose symporter-like transporter
MKYPDRLRLTSLVAAAGIFDSLALTAAVFGALVNIQGNHPRLSAWAYLAALVMFVVLAIIAVADEH